MHGKQINQENFPNDNKIEKEQHLLFPHSLFSSTAHISKAEFLHFGQTHVLVVVAEIKDVVAQYQYLAYLSVAVLHRWIFILI